MTLRIGHVHKRLAGRRVLVDVSLECAAGAPVTLLGENGAGKSTLLSIVAGILAPDEGIVTLDGATLLGDHPPARRRLGFVPEHPDALPHATVGELVALVAALKGAAVDQAVLGRVGVAELLERRLGTLSLGQRRRAFVAAALVGAPGCLILDEPTNGLDPDGITMLGELLRERAAAGAVVMVATHDLPFAAGLAGRTVRLSGNSVA